MKVKAVDIEDGETYLFTFKNNSTKKQILDGMKKTGLNMEYVKWTKAK